MDVDLADGGTAHLPPDVALVATGSQPLRPASVPFDGLDVHDSDTILTLRALPQRQAWCWRRSG